MKASSTSLDDYARLNLPRPPGPHPVLPKPPRAEDLGRTLHAPALLRARLALSGTGFTPPPQPFKAPHRDPVLSLVHRISQGFNVVEYERAREMGYEAYLEEQLDPDSIDDSVVDTRLEQHFQTLFMSPKELVDTYSEDQTEPYTQLKGAMLLRAVNSKRQLFERIYEFWSDHFNIDHNKGDISWALLPEHDRTVLRAHALGSFPEMLHACAFGGAMLYYLDNWLNVHGAPQENYARELLELHTLSVHGGYNEADVDEVAKCFTGWTLVDRPNSADWLRGTFDPRLHTGGPKFVLGYVIQDPKVAPSGGLAASKDASKVLDILAAHQSTANFIALKLLRRFLTPTPPAELVAQVRETYLSTQGDIKAMLRVILARENMRFASVMQPKFKRPFHFMTSLYRMLDANMRRPLESLTHLGSLGQVPYDFPPPTGYPDDTDSWGSLLLPRWVFANLLFRPYYGNGINGVYPMSVSRLLARIGFTDASDRPGLARRINDNLLGQTLSEPEVEILQDFISGYPTDYGIFAIFDTLALAVSLPGFQSY